MMSELKQADATPCYTCIEELGFRLSKTFLLYVTAKFSKHVRHAVHVLNNVIHCLKLLFS